MHIEVTYIHVPHNHVRYNTKELDTNPETSRIVHDLNAQLVRAGAYAEFLKGGGPNFKISGILDIHAASSEAASLY